MGADTICNTKQDNAWPGNGAEPGERFTDFNDDCLR